MSESKNPSRPSHARQSYRSRHRSQSHADAHADPEQLNVHHVEHPLVASGSAELVTTDEALARLVTHLREQRSFAYDSEFIGELTYHPKLCLIQVATTKRVALIDPLAPLELAPLWEVLTDPTVEKVVHAGEQDIEPVARLTGRCCANLFDTQIAAGFVGLAYPVSLSKLVRELTGARLGKGLTFTHWDQRPLSSVQLRYAADDVRYLPAVRDALGKRLNELGHEQWASEESEALADPKRYAFDPDTDFLRLRGAGTLSPAQLAVLRDLVIWRDEMSRTADVPPRAYLRDEILVDMARRPPKTVDRLERVRGLPRPVEREHGATIVDLVNRASQNPLNNPPEHAPEPTPAERFRADSLFALVQVLCLGQSIDTNLVASRQDIGELTRLLQHGGDAASHKLLRGWRRDAVGQQLLEVVEGRSTISIHWSGNRLRLLR